MKIKKGDCKICIWFSKEENYCTQFALDQYDNCENWAVDWENNAELRIANKDW